MAERGEDLKSKDESFARDALRWMDDVYRFALSLTRDPSDAQDIVQETYLRAYRSWHTFQPGSDGRRWLFTICRNVFLRSRQQGRLEVEVSDGDAEAVAAAREHKAMIDDGTDRLLASVDLGPALDSRKNHVVARRQAGVRCPGNDGVEGAAGARRFHHEHIGSELP